MKVLHHKAKLAFLMQEEASPMHFYQLDDGRILMIEITRGQLAGFVADGALRLSKIQPGVDAYQAPIASATNLSPQPPVADAPFSSEAKR